MDSFARQKAQNDAAAAAADSQYQRYSYGPSQQRLPPFRTLLSENSPSDANQAAYHASVNQASVNGSSVSHQPHPASTSRPSGSPSLSSRPAPIPSLSQGFDDLNPRFAEQPVYSSTAIQRPAEYVVGASNGSLYPDSSTPYPAHPMAGHHFDAYPSMSHLPSIGEMHDRRDRNGRGVITKGPPHPTSFPADAMANGSSMVHAAHPASRDHSAYAAYGPGDVTAAGDPLRYSQSTVHHPSRPYSTAVYGEMDYPSQAFDPAHPADFAVLGDRADARSKRRRGNLPKQVTDILRAWFHEHLDHPYPSEEDKQMFIARTGLSISQISNWFINARRRHLPSLRHQVRAQEQGRHSMLPRDQLSCHESSLSPM